jgi:hypothetical protein
MRLLDSVEARSGSAAPVESPWHVVSRTVRIPIGYVLLAAAGVLLLLIVVYMVGYWRAERALKAQYSTAMLESTRQGDTAGRVADPLSPRPGAATGAGSAEPPEGAGPSPRAAVGRSTASWGPIETDPRQPGRWYLVLAETRREGAIRLATFCRQHGVEAYAVGSNNARFRVFVLPGLTGDGRTDPQEDPLRRRVYEVGRLWQERHRGESNLRDAYLSQFEGR